jgi:hypothetical protein
MRLLAVLIEGDEVGRYLRGIGEPTELPAQAPAPPLRGFACTPQACAGRRRRVA